MRRSRTFRLTIRGRLTLVYGGLFLAAGVVLLGVTYVLASAQLLGTLPPSGASASAAAPNAPGSELRPTPAAGTGKPAAISPAPGRPEGDNLPAVIRQTREKALHELLSQGGIALALVGATAMGLGWLIAGRMLQPLHRITGTARRIADAPASDGRLGERIALDGPPDEIKDLADTFDLMLERIDHSFDGQRRFIANAAHELRTPLTLSRTLIDVAMETGTVPAQLRHLGGTLLAINTRHERLIDGLLLLARSEREVARRTYVDLADVVAHVVARVRSDTVRVDTDLAEAPTTGDSVLLERLVQNLVDNGVKHNIAQHGWVHISSGTPQDGTAVIEVSNTGPVVPHYDVPSIFEPFHRLDGDRLATATGAGLGLSIVRAVASAHNGDVRAEPRDEGGLVVTVTLPAAT